MTRLRDDDGDRRRKLAGSPCFVASDGQAIERQHRAVAEMEAGERGRQDQQRLAFQQHPEAAGLAVVVAFLEAARRLVVDGAGGNQQDRNDRQHAEYGRQPEHRGEAELPAEKAGQAGADHVAGMIERLIASVLPIEAGLPHDAERHARHRRPDRRARDRGRDLRERDQPKTL